MKKLLTLTLILFAFGCESPKGERIKKGGYNIVEIDSCEYIEVSFATGLDIGYYSLTHKGNCNFCKTRSKLYKDEDWLIVREQPIFINDTTFILNGMTYQKDTTKKHHPIKNDAF